MFFMSDNTGPAHPAIMRALTEANSGFAAPYGADDWTAAAVANLRDVLEAPKASVNLVATGTAANSIALAALCPPWATTFCSSVAHIHEDECNAPEFYSGGAKLTLVGDGEKLTPESLRAAIEAEEIRGVHGPQRGPVSITQATEKGTLYSPAEIRAICDVAHGYGLKVHMDGARFANAVVSLGVTPAELTWKAGVDALSFGGTKNGLMGVEAIVMFDPDPDWEVQLRRKRGAHLFSKQRFLGAQMAEYVRDGLWLETARAANALCATLAEGLRAKGAVLDYEPEANIIFARLPRSTHARLQAAGAQYYLWDSALDGGSDDDMLLARFVCDWSLPRTSVEEFLSLL